MLKIIRLTLLLSAAFFLTPWLASYAYGTGYENDGYKAIHIEASDRSATPCAKILGGATGSIAPGDLFYIDATDSSHDMTASLYLTNAHKLTPYLRYLILEVGIYFENSDSQWKKLSLLDGNQVPDTFITLQNSPVNFILPGCTRYKVTIDSGSYYCLPANTNGNSLSPSLYLTVEPL